jgi:hypothetical protein
MNPEPTTPTTSVTPSATSEATAATYIAQELPKARLAFKRARIFGVVLICLVGAYISVISITLVKFSQPQEAAQITSGMLIQHISNEGPALLGEVEREIPHLIRQLPDYIIEQLPTYRRDTELVLESELRGHCDLLSKQVGKQMDGLIDAHQADLKALLQNPNNREAIRNILPNLDQTITDFLANDADGKVLHEHITELAAGLTEVQKHMDRLANGTNLTPEEQKARHSLAMIGKAIKDQTKELGSAPTAMGKLARK